MIGSNKGKRTKKQELGLSTNSSSLNNLDSEMDTSKDNEDQPKLNSMSNTEVKKAKEGLPDTISFVSGDTDALCYTGSLIQSSILIATNINSSLCLRMFVEDLYQKASGSSTKEYIQFSFVFYRFRRRKS